MKLQRKQKVQAIVDAIGLDVGKSYFAPIFYMSHSAYIPTKMTVFAISVVIAGDGEGIFILGRDSEGQMRSSRIDECYPNIALASAECANRNMLMTSLSPKWRRDRYYAERNRERMNGMRRLMKHAKQGD